jgi:hypothetical protein
VPVVMCPDFYFNIDLLSTTVGVYDVAGQIVVICCLASATGFLTSFPVQTVEIRFLPILRGNIVARSWRLRKPCACMVGMMERRASRSAVKLTGMYMVRVGRLRV